MDFYEFRAMNSGILLGAEGQAAERQRGFEQVAAWIQVMEARLTRFSETSELAELNRSGGRWFEASPELLQIMEQAQELYRQTGGLFDPAVLDALERSGYDRSMDEIRAVGAGRPILSLDLVRCDFGAVDLDTRSQAVRLTPGMRIDLGGIAKGWIAQHAAERLATFASPCVVDAGGDMFMIGQPSDQDAWEVALEDPRDPEQVLAILKIGPGAVATSSVMRRRWQQGDRMQHHLIDPRRAEPAETDWLCVTAIAPEATVAEVFAKALLIAGPEQAPALVRQRQDVEYIAVDREGQLWGSAKAREYMDVGIR